MQEKTGRKENDMHENTKSRSEEAPYSHWGQLHPAESPSPGDGRDRELEFRAKLLQFKFEQEVFDLFTEYYRLQNKIDLREFLERLEKIILCRTLSKFNGNQKGTSRFLNLKYTTLNQKLKKHSIHFRKEPVDDLLMERF